MTTGHPTSPGGQRPLAEAQSPVLPAPCAAGRARRAGDEALWAAHALLPRPERDSNPTRGGGDGCAQTSTACLSCPIAQLTEEQAVNLLDLFWFNR